MNEEGHMRTEPSLTDEQFEELGALCKINDAIKGPSFMNVCQWRPLYEGLVRRKLVDWQPHPVMSSRYRETTITDKGRAVLCGEA